MQHRFRSKVGSRKRSDTGEAEVEVPGALLAPSVVWARLVRNPTTSCVSGLPELWSRLIELKRVGSGRRPMPRSESKPRRELQHRSRDGGDWAVKRSNGAKGGEWRAWFRGVVALQKEKPAGAPE